MLKKLTIAFAASAAALLAATTSGMAQTKLKWAHVYETSEPFHTASVWAAGEIGKRTNGRYAIDVYPASQLGKETDINQGLSLGSVDMIISGSSFAAKSFPPIGVTYYPYTFRDADHLLAYTKSDVFKELTKGYEDKTGHRILAVTYYGVRHTSSNKPIKACADMKASANSDASIRPERSSRVMKPILSPFLFFITRRAMIIPATVCVSRAGFRSMMR